MIRYGLFSEIPRKSSEPEMDVGHFDVVVDKGIIRPCPRRSAEDRHQFLGHAGFLLALVSFIGVVYDTLPLIILGTCR